ncbi:MAG: hypothetical protein IPN42_04545 [Methylococcaceae bacterium]|nr:hypothetical protein [Methylococcaceae bacterium]
MKRCLLFVVILALIIPIALVGLMSGEAGSRWLLQSIFSVVPERIAVENIRGRLLDHFELTGLHYQSGGDTADIDTIDFAWQPAQLFSGTLKIVDLTVKGVNASVTKTTEENKNKETSVLDAIKLPIQFDIGNILVTEVQFTSDGQSQVLDKLQLSAKTEGNQIKLLSFAINSDMVNAEAKGAVTLEKGFPLNLKADWRINADKNGVWKGNTIVGGDLNKLVFDNHLDSPFKLVLNGQVEDALKTPRIIAKGVWSNLVFPFVATPPQIQSKEGHFELDGLLTNYRLTINGQLSQQYVPQATLSFDGRGGLDAMNITNLELKSSTGIFQLTGSTSWGNTPAFDLTATGQKFNPAIIVPELPGSLTFSSHIIGNLDSKALKINADIDKLYGQLRKQPLNSSGKLALNGDQLKVDSFLAALGANKITVDGLVGQTNGDLVFAMDMPTLSTFWPTLGGSLQGSGSLQGGWQNPTVKFDAQGKHLTFAEHGLNELAVNIDYQPGEQSISTINVSANTIKSGTTQINKLSLEGKGTPKQHGFNANISSPEGTFSTALTGGLTGNNWKGDITKLNLTPKDGKSWSLKDKVPLGVDKKQQGIDVTLSEGCLVQQTASLCTKGSYLANGDLGFQLNAKAIPSGLAQTFMPEQMTVTSLLNANVDIQRQKNSLTGDYRIDTTPTEILLKSRETQREIQLGASSLSGNIKGEKVSADIDLHLAGHDYLQGRLLLDIGKTQAISGTHRRINGRIFLDKNIFPANIGHQRHAKSRFRLTRLDKQAAGKRTH